MRVRVTKDGPYIVTGGVPLAEQRICVDSEGECHGWEEGPKQASVDEYALCRCGGSHHKPHCDGTHATAGFDGTETATGKPYLEQAVEYEGPDLKLTDAPELCAEARFCHRAGGAWNLTRRSGDPAARETAIEESCECPSGRLLAWEKDGKAIEPDLEPSLGLVEDTKAGKMGPLWVRGRVPIESADGKLYEVRNRVTLCRCGRSKNKPFCDGSHLH